MAHARSGPAHARPLLTEPSPARAYAAGTAMVLLGGLAQLETSPVPLLRQLAPVGVLSLACGCVLLVSTALRRWGAWRFLAAAVVALLVAAPLAYETTLATRSTAAVASPSGGYEADVLRTTNRFWTPTTYRVLVGGSGPFSRQTLVWCRVVVDGAAGSPPAVGWRDERTLLVDDLPLPVDAPEVGCDGAD